MTISIFKEVFKQAKHFKPKHNLIAEQMDELNDELFGFDKLELPIKEE